MQLLTLMDLKKMNTTLSAFWILSLNSWMQHPTGFELRDGIVHPTDWWEIVFNPTFPLRLAHMLIASGLTASFLIAGISAYRLFKGDEKRAPRMTLKTGCFLSEVRLKCCP